MSQIATVDPASGLESKARSSIRAGISIALLSLIFLAIGAGYGCYRFGSLPNALAYLRGERLLLDARFKSVEGARPGSQVIVRYRLSNVSGHPVKLVGTVSSCTCTSVSDIPTTLAPSETREFSARINVAEEMSDFSGTVRLFTDEPHHAEIALAYLVRVAPTPAGVRKAD